MGALITICAVAISSVLWMIKFLFLGGWLLARWIVWLTWPLSASLVGLGAAFGLL